MPPRKLFATIPVLALTWMLSAAPAADSPPAKPAAKPAAGKPAAKPAGWSLRQVLVGDPKLPHVLLVGDSILGGYHGKAGDLLRGQVNLDAWITPQHIGPGDLPKDMLAVLAAHSYDLILFNDIGLHAWTPGRIPEGKYEPWIRLHVANLRKHAPQAQLIFATTTPMTTKTRPIGLDPEYNGLIAQRNRIAVQVMNENHIPVADYYALLVDKLELAAGDRFHWSAPAYALLAQCAASHIREALHLPAPARPDAGQK